MRTYQALTISGAKGIMLDKIDYILAFKKFMVWWRSRPKKKSERQTKSLQFIIKKANW